MKWVKVSEGHHKLVDDSDDRPEDKEFVESHHRKPGESFSIAFRPSWARWEKDMGSDNAQVARNATDNFLAERDRETRHSGNARRWEDQRKTEIRKNKPQYLKKQKQAEENKVATEIKKELGF